MRVKSHWFKSGRDRTPQELAGAAAFIVWRIGENALKSLRSADFDIAADAQYFAFLAEFLIFLVQLADRIAYRHLNAEERATFTSALANRVGATLSENRSELLGGAADAIKADFIALLNLRADDYANFEYEKDKDNFGFVRCLGLSLEGVMDERDRNWVTDQVMAIEAPEAVATLERAMSGLLELEPRRRTARSDAD
jgi:hypothetical protein